MNKKKAVILLLLTLIILAGAPESYARSQYLTDLNAAYGGGTCGTCHVRPSGGGPRNDYGMLFENQPDHATDPGAALTAIGSPFSSTATPLITPAATMPPATTDVPTATDTIPPAPTETPFETVSPPVTTVTATGTPAAPGFGIALPLVGLFACALLARRHNK